MFGNLTEKVILGYLLIKNSVGFSFVIVTMILGMLFGVLVGNIETLGGYSGIVNIPPPGPINIPLLPSIESINADSSPQT